jgi:hypothetical protein
MATTAACSKVRFAGLGASLFWGARVLGEGALAGAEHLVAGLEPGHVVADRLHHAGHVRTWNGGLGRAEPKAREAYRVRQARHDVPDAPVHASRMHSYQHLVVGYLGLVDVPELENIRRTVGVLDDRLHGFSSLGDVAIQPRHLRLRPLERFCDEVGACAGHVLDVTGSRSAKLGRRA